MLYDWPGLKGVREFYTLNLLLQVPAQYKCVIPSPYVKRPPLKLKLVSGGLICVLGVVSAHSD